MTSSIRCAAGAALLLASLSFLSACNQDTVQPPPNLPPPTVAPASPPPKSETPTTPNAGSSASGAKGAKVGEN